MADDIVQIDSDMEEDDTIMSYLQAGIIKQEVDEQVDVPDAVDVPAAAVDAPAAAVDVPADTGAGTVAASSDDGLMAGLIEGLERSAWPFEGLVRPAIPGGGRSGHVQGSAQKPEDR